MKKWNGVRGKKWKWSGESAIEVTEKRNEKGINGNECIENKDVSSQGRKGWLVMRVMEVEKEGKEVGMMNGRV